MNYPGKVSHDVVVVADVDEEDDVVGVAVVEVEDGVVVVDVIEAEASPMFNVAF